VWKLKANGMSMERAAIPETTPSSQKLPEIYKQLHKTPDNVNSTPTYQ